MHTGFDGFHKVLGSQDGFIHPLGEARYARENGTIGVLDLLSNAGLPVPEGFIVTHEAHRGFLRFSGLTKEMRSLANGRYGIRQQTRELRRRYTKQPPEEMLSRAISGALLELGARTVVVHSARGSEAGLGTIPSVLAAVRRIWLSNQTLERQIVAVTGEEAIPTWPVLVQRESYPEYTGWSTTRDLSESGEPESRREGSKVALYDMEPADKTAPKNSIAYLTLEAEAVLGGPTRLEWGLEGGLWYLLSIGRENDERKPLEYLWR